jgi:beta-glucosidase
MDLTTGDLSTLRAPELTLDLPADFRWGVATASYQIEGAVAEDGRTPSIWDTFSRVPGAVTNGDNGDIACDHYHRMPEDVAMIGDLGLDTYRFSVAWPRVQPGGRGPVNPAGLDFYERLVDELLAKGIDPWVTLYHWDLPQELEDAGGWPVRDTAYRFADYSMMVFDRLQDRVRTWTTLNEPWCSAMLGYAFGEHAPGRKDFGAGIHAVHHLLLGHGLAARALRAAGAHSVSITLNPASVLPLDPDNAADVEAARIVDGLNNRIFLDPLIKGQYPADMLEHMKRFTNLDFIVDGDEAVIQAPIDLLGVNFYQPAYVSAKPGEPASEENPGTEGIAFRKPVGPVTDMNWQIEPAGLTRLLERLHRDYGVPMLITENGAAYPDGPGADGRVHDTNRIEYLDGHLRACHDAISNGVDLRGYFVWSLMDNFEWAEGYAKRFGIVHVDYRTQARLPKDSARWYSEVIRRNGLE